MTAYYNENDPRAAAWLRELIKARHVAHGEVDTRSIEDVTPNDLRGYTQCHFFAGIGGWSYALRLAGVADDRAVWTGSCPCQPFSAAGKGEGFADERHLWPAFFHLISECRPDTVFGEQVASKAGLAWFDLVQVDLEAAAYACGAADLCAASVGAPHIRQRLYWVAKSARRLGHTEGSDTQGMDQRPLHGGVVELGDSSSSGGRWDSGTLPRTEAGSEGKVRSEPDEFEPSGVLGHAAGERLEEQQCERRTPRDASRANPWEAAERAGAPTRVWCRDGKWRPVEPGTFPLAHGVPERVGLLRGYGNAIVPQLAAAFIEAAGVV